MRKRRQFTPEFKAQVVLDVLSGNLSPSEACRKHALRGCYSSKYLYDDTLFGWQGTSLRGPRDRLRLAPGASQAPPRPPIVSDFT